MKRLLDDPVHRLLQPVDREPLRHARYVSQFRQREHYPGDLGEDLSPHLGIVKRNPFFASCSAQSGLQKAFTASFSSWIWRTSV